MAFLPTPQPQPVPGSSVTLVAFYFPGHNTLWDDICQAPFLGNFWPASVTIQPPGKVAGTFHVAEAAFQATKWWGDDRARGLFEAAPTGDAAFKLTQNEDAHGNPLRPPLPSPDDGAHGYAGYQRTGPDIESWKQASEGAMWAVLQAKFQDPDLKAGLLATGDAYLLEHNSRATRDRYWSDGRDGGGKNRLGIVLMELRARLGGSGMPAGAPSLATLAATAESL